MIDSNENKIALLSGASLSLTPEHFGCSLASDNNVITLFDGPNVMGKILSVSVEADKGDSTVLTSDDLTLDGKTEIKLFAGSEIILRRTQGGYVTVFATDLEVAPDSGVVAPDSGVVEPVLLVAVATVDDPLLLAPDPTLLDSPMLVPVPAVVVSPLVVHDPLVEEVLTPEPVVVVPTPEPVVVVPTPEPVVVVPTPEPVVVVPTPEPTATN